MNTKKHPDHPHLTGEHRWGDTGQLILLILFLVIWITDSFAFHYSTFLTEKVSNVVRMPLSGVIFIISAIFWTGIIGFYFYISKYEERILIEEFGDDYLKYKKKVGMLLPKF